MESARKAVVVVTHRVNDPAHVRGWEAKMQKLFIRNMETLKFFLMFFCGEFIGIGSHLISVRNWSTARDPINHLLSGFINRPWKRETASACLHPINVCY